MPIGSVLYKYFISCEDSALIEETYPGKPVPCPRSSSSVLRSVRKWFQRRLQCCHGVSLVWNHQTGTIVKARHLHSVLDIDLTVRT